MQRLGRGAGLSGARSCIENSTDMRLTIVASHFAQKQSKWPRVWLLLERYGEALSRPLSGISTPGVSRKRHCGQIFARISKCRGNRQILLVFDGEDRGSPDRSQAYFLNNRA